MATINIRKGRKGRKYVQLNYSQGGRQKRESLGPVADVTPHEAKVARDAKSLELRTGKKIFTVAPLFDTHIEEYLAWHAAEYPDSHYRVEQICHDHFGRFRGKRLSDITPKDVDLWKAERRQAVRSNTVVKEFRTLHAVFRRGIAWKSGIVENPCDEATQPKGKDSRAPVWYTVEQVALLAQRPTHGAHWRFMANTGLRRSEALLLPVECVELARGVVRIESREEDEDDEGEELEGGRTKSGKWREVPLNPVARAAFHECMRDRKGQQFVFPKICPPSLSRAFVNDAERCGLKGSLHCLRHTYTAHLVMKGVPLRTVKDLLGHASFTTTLKYAHLAPDHLREQALKVAI